MGPNLIIVYGYRNSPNYLIELSIEGPQSIFYSTFTHHTLVDFLKTRRLHSKNRTIVSGNRSSVQNEPLRYIVNFIQGGMF